MDIVEFLKQRITEDEEDARAADHGRWNHEDKVVTFEFWDAEHGEYDWNTMLSVDTRANGWHIVNWSPARVLAECQAKRAIVEDHREEVGYVVAYRESDRLIAEGYDLDTVPLRGSAAMIPACLRHLAAVYADHPDYRDEWKPT